MPPDVRSRSLNDDAYARPSHSSDERAALSLGDSSHLRKAVDKDRGHLIAGKTSVGQNEGANAGSQQSLAFVLSVPDSVVLRKHDPSPCSHSRKPLQVFCVRREVVVMDLDQGTCTTECL